MLIPLLVAATLAQTDTIPFTGWALLGDVVENSAAAAASDGESWREPLPTVQLMNVELPPPRLTFAMYAAMPLPEVGLAGFPTHTLQPADLTGFSQAELDAAVRAVEGEMRRGGFAGAALAVGRWDRTVLERGIGTHDRLRGSPAVDPDYTIYDLASLTKVVATTTAVMLLYEDGKIELDAPVERYLPAFSGGNKSRVTIRHLLTHTSGLPAGGNTAGATPGESLASAMAIPLRQRPGSRVEYSDIGFIILWAAAEAAHGAPLPGLLEERVFDPLDMRFTSYLPGELCIRCAPTLERPGYRGVVHDPVARRLGGIAGHAGLFSTAHDLSRFAAMLANGGELDGVRVLRGSTIALFTQRQNGAGTRALGWDTPDLKGGGAAGLAISPTSFGHTGFTGTSLWVDPDRGSWVILLSNRTLTTTRTNRIQELRRELNDRVATSIDSAR